MLPRSPSRVRLPQTLPPERVLFGELHLLRFRLDELLAVVARVVATSERGEEWLAVEEAARLARRAVAAAAGAAPPPRRESARVGELVVGQLRVDPVARRQWYGEAEFELTPLHQRLLAVMAAEPRRVFGTDELSRAVWDRDLDRESCAVKVAVSKLRRALVAAGAPRGVFLLSAHGVGWSLSGSSDAA
jgi:DNA-binding response OmpR family regulator